MTQHSTMQHPISTPRGMAQPNKRPQPHMLFVTQQHALTRNCHPCIHLGPSSAS
jgi:hypothetical protein